MQLLTFDKWMKEVDEVLARHLGGLTHMDLPDKDYRGLHQAQDTPLAAARFVVEDEGYDPDELGFPKE